MHMIIAFMVDDMGIVIVLKNFSICRVDDMATVTCENAAPFEGISCLRKRVRDIQCLSPAKKYKLYKSSINKSIHFVQRSLSSSTRG